MKKILTLIAFCAISGLAEAKIYDPYTNYEDAFYFGISGNASFLPYNKLHDEERSGRIDYNRGGGINLSTGFNFLQALRAEIEGGYHYLNLDKTQFGGLQQERPKGNLKILSGMVNAYVDLHNFFNFAPYVGAGAGLASVVIPSSVFDTQKSQDTRKAYQLMAGFSYTAPSLPCVNWFIGYRYQVINAPSFLVRDTSTGTKISFENIAIHNAEAGIRFNF